MQGSVSLPLPNPLEKDTFDMNHGTTLMAAAGSLLVTGAATAGAFQSLSMTAYTGPRSGAPSNSVTYRLYANLEIGARIDAVFADARGDISISTANGASFYHNPNGGPTSLDINSNFFSFVPSMEWDSYVSIGALYQNGAPFGENSFASVGIDWDQWESGGDIFSSQGLWNTGPDHVMGEEVGGQVFLGQFTVTDGVGDVSDLVGQLSLLGQDADGNVWEEVGVTWMESTDPAVPGIGALAPLACIGLVRRRRRG